MDRSNLVIFKPELLGSSDQAGGQRSNNQVESGKLNELWTPISDISHAQSAIDIVKAYPALFTQGTEQLVGAHIAISAPPTDELVSTMIVEAAALNDESRMVEMKEILESSVTAGALIRKGGPGFLPYQNTFSRNYLTYIEVFNQKDYKKTTYLGAGQIIAISVEYPGNENEDYPRRIHYAMVTDPYAPGTAEGNVAFDPPIDFKTPEADVVINGEAGCTRLRLVNEASPLKFHGVTKLTQTAAAGANALDVRETKQEFIPSVISRKVHAGLTLKTDDSEAVTSSHSKPAVDGQTYVFQVNDVLTGDNTRVDYTVKSTYVSGGRTYTDGIVVVATDAVSVTTPRQPDIPSQVSISYMSSDRYSAYQSTEPFPGGKLVRGTIDGTATLTDASGTSTVSIFDRDDGYVYSGTSTVGVMDYSTGTITITDSRFSNIAYQALLEGGSGTTQVTFPLAVTDPVLETFYVQATTLGGQLISGSSDASGTITGTITGSITDGVASLVFSTAVTLDSLSYDIEEVVKSLPPADVYGLNPLRIPDGGVVKIFNEWGVVSIQHSNFQVVSSPAPGQTKNIRAGARFADITDKDGKSLWTAANTNFTVDLEAGTVTINSDFTGFTAPFTLVDTIGELALVTATADKKVSLASGITQEYPVGATVASVQSLGDLQARVGKVRDMKSWDNNWDVDGEPAQGNLNVVDHPIELNNATAINEDWAIVFTSDTAFRVVGRRVGQIGTGDTLNDVAIINPLTGQPFWILRKEAFGGGWNQGEAIRFETYAGYRPVMLVRVVKSGHSQITTDRATLTFRGNEA